MIPKRDMSAKATGPSTAATLSSRTSAPICASAGRVRRAGSGGPGQAGRVRRAELLICGPEARHRAAGRRAYAQPCGNLIYIYSPGSPLEISLAYISQARYISRYKICETCISRYEVREIYLEIRDTRPLNIVHSVKRMQRPIASRPHHVPGPQTQRHRCARAKGTPQARQQHVSSTHLLRNASSPTHPQEPIPPPSTHHDHIRLGRHSDHHHHQPVRRHVPRAPLQPHKAVPAPVPAPRHHLPPIHPSATALPLSAALSAAVRARRGHIRQGTRRAVQQGARALRQGGVP